MEELELEVLGRVLPLCRHCGEKPGVRARGLCWNCYSKPYLRRRYAGITHTQRVRRLPAGYKCRGMTSQLPTAPEATTALPGTKDKVEVMRQRDNAGYALCHPLDPTMESITAQELGRLLQSFEQRSMIG